MRCYLLAGDFSVIRGAFLIMCGGLFVKCGAFFIIFTDLVLARFETRLTVQGSQNGSHSGQDVVAGILKELRLGHLIELFHREKYSRYNFHNGL